MSWARLDDGILDHPKFLELFSRLSGLKALAASGLWMRALVYASKHETDGFIPAAALHVISPQVRDSFVTLSITALVESRLWSTVEGGWMIHDFTSWNPTREAKEQQRARWRNAKRKGAESTTLSPPTFHRGISRESTQEHDTLPHETPHETPRRFHASRPFPRNKDKDSGTPPGVTALPARVADPVPASDMSHDMGSSQPNGRTAPHPTPLGQLLSDGFVRANAAAAERVAALRRAEGKA